MRATLGDACVGRRCIPTEPDGRVPQRLPTKRECGDSGVQMKVAVKMPWFPTHETVCNGQPCRPGEGNLKHERERKPTPRGWRYKQWSQPYIHREAWVQHRSRDLPHFPDPSTTYAALVAAARRVATDNLVLVTAGDWDYRELVINWVAHTRKLRYTNALVLSMDRELSEDLGKRRVAFADLSEQLQHWNGTCRSGSAVHQPWRTPHFSTYLFLNLLLSSIIPTACSECTLLYVCARLQSVVRHRLDTIQSRGAQCGFFDVAI